MDIVEAIVGAMFKILFAIEHIINMITVISDNVLRCLFHSVVYIFCLAIDYTFALILIVLHLYTSFLFIIQTLNLGIIMMLIKIINCLLGLVSGGHYRPLPIYQLAGDDAALLVHIEVTRFCARIMHIIYYAMDQRQQWVTILMEYSNQEYAQAYHQAQNAHAQHGQVQDGHAPAGRGRGRAHVRGA